MFDKIIAHTSFIGETGYANHSRNFFTALNKLIPVKVRNFAAGETWTGLNNGEPHNNEWYLTDEHKEMLYKQTCLSGDKRTDYYIYGGDEEVEKGNNLHIVLNEVNHHYFYDNYDGPKIAYTVWESTLYPDNFFNKIQEFDQLWVPTKWQKDCSINQGYAENKIRVVPEAVDGNIFYPEEVSLLDEYKDGRFKFLLLGRWDYRKCTKEIIESFLRVFKNDDPVDLVVSIDNIFATDGIKTTEERLEYFNFNDDRIKVKHFPSRENYVKYLKTGHVFLSCARGEGWNLPLIESMACGTPSIYSNWGAQLEYANDKGIPVNIIEEKLASSGSGYKMISGDIPGNYGEPDFENLCMVMRDAYENHDDHKQKALKDSEDIRKEFTWGNSVRKAIEYLSEFEDRNIFQGTRKHRLVDEIIDEVYNKKVYEKYFKVEDGDIVVDIGGHIGTFARSISDRNFEKCFCIEPDKVNIGDISVNLSSTTKINDYEIINYAIDDDTGSNFFHRGNMGFNRKAKDALEGEAVDTISFLDFINKYNVPRIDFLKLDCEGGEFAVLGNEENHDFIESNVKKIAGELHLLSTHSGKRDGLNLMNRLKDMGFKVTLNSVDGVDITNYFPDHVDYYTEILFYAEKLSSKHMELYQDQYVNGEVIEKGIRDCSSRYDAMKQVFDKYERPFTILDIGANFGYYSIRAATEYDATAVMIESEENECSKLISLADRNNCKDRLIVLNKRMSLYELKELAKCEHFDVVLALNVIHHFGDEDIEEVCEVFSNLGDNLIIETPPIDDKNACGGKHLKPINDFYSGREKMLLGSFDRHTCDGKSDIYWLETPKDKLLSTYFEYDTLFINGTVDEKVTLYLHKKDNIVNSTFAFKNLDNKRHNRVSEWIHGINLMTFIKLNGRYPFPENIISKIERRDVETGYEWDNKNNDLVLHNIIVNGSDLHLIDYDDKIVSVSSLSDSEQIDIILRTLRKHYNLLREGIDGNVAVNFSDGPFVEITGRNSDKEYDVLFVNRKDSEIIHNGSIKCNHWIKASRRWYTDWDIVVNVNGRKVFSHTLDLKGKRVLVGMESKSLGDNIAWIPYVEEFRKKHQCNIFVATFWNFLFEKEYPNLRFISPGQIIPNIYATYKFGWFTPFNVNNNPNDFRTISLQQCASDILGLEHKEIRPLITIPDKPKVIKDKYVCIGIHGTSQCKYWNRPNGWKDVISYLNKKNYKAVMIHKEKGTYMGNIPPDHVINKTGDFPIEERIIDLKYADAFIGIGSGLSWLAWAVGTPVVMISGFSKPWCEFTTGVERLHNPDVCNGCFNDSSLTFNKGDWEWCPRDKDFECTKSITSDMVIERIDKILGNKHE